jgi:hypothetical protein
MHIDRTGLYIMVFIILINTCSTYSIVNRMERDIEIIREATTYIRN